MSDILQIMVEGRIDESQESITALKQQIKTLEKKLRDEEISIKATLDKDSIKQIEQEVDEAVKTLEQATQVSAFQQIKEELSKSVKEVKDLSSGLVDINKQAEMLKMTTKEDFFSGTITNTQELKKDLITIDKLVETYNNKGQLIQASQEKTLNFIEAQKTIYSDLEKSLSKINTLEKEKLKASEVDKAKIDYQINQQKALVSELDKSLDMYNLRSDKIESEIKSTQKLREIQQSIRSESSQENRSNKAYSELVKAIKEEGRIASQMVDTQGELNKKYSDRLKIATQLRQEIEKQISSDGLSNPEKELRVRKEIERVNATLAIQEQKSLDKETLRVKKLNDRMTTLQELLKTERDSVNIKSNKDVILQQIKEMDEFALSTAKGKTQILSYRETLDSLGNVQARVNIQTDQGKGLVRQHNLVIDQATQSIYKLSERTKEASNRSLGYVESIKVAMQRSLQWALTTKLVAMSFNYIRDSVKHVIEMDNQLNQVQMVTKMTKEQVDALSESYYRLGDRLGKTASEIAVVNTDLIRQGLTASEAMNRLETTLKFSATASIDTQHALSIVTSGVNALGTEAEQLVDVLLMAGNITASSADQIGDALTRVASSAKSTGTSIEEVTAIMSTLIEVTQESPSSLGNSLKTLMARFNKVNEETGEFNTSINETQKAFESVGIKFTDANGQIKPFYELLSELNQVWKDLDGNTKSYIATASAGANQRNRFLAIMENFNKVQNNHNDLLNAEGTLTESYGIYVDSLEAKLNKLKNTLQEGMTNIVNSDLVGAIILIADAIARAVIVFNSFGITIGHVLVSYMALKKVMNFSGGGEQAFIKVMDRNIANFKDLAKAIIEAGGAGEAFNIVLGALKNKSNTVQVATNGASTSVKLLSTSMTSASVQAGALSVGLALLSTIGVMLLVTALAKAVNYMATAKQRLEELGRTTSESIREHKKNISTLESLGEEFESLQDKMHGYGTTLKLTQEEEARYYEVSAKIADFAPEVVQSYNDKEQAIIQYGTSIDNLIEKEKTLIDLENYKLMGSKNKFDVKLDRVIAYNTNPRHVVSKNIEKLKAEIAEVEKDYNSKLELGQDPSKEIQVLEEKRIKLNDLIMKHKEYTAIIVEGVKSYEPIIQAYTSEIEGIEGVDSALGNLIKNITMSKFSAEGMAFSTTEATKLLTETQVALEDFQKSTKGQGEMEFVKQLDILNEKLIEVGYTSEEADNILYQLGTKGLGLEEMSKALQGIDMSLNLEEIKEATKEIDSLSSAYKKLAQGQNLSANEMIDLITTYEEIAEIVNEQGDLNQDNMDVLLEIMEKTHQARLNDLIDTQKQNLAQRELAIATLESYQRILEFLDGIGLGNGRLYDYVSTQIEVQRNEVKALEVEYAKLEAQSKALANTMDKTFHNQKLEDYQSSVQKTNSQIRDLENILQDMNKQGRITSEIADTIISKYPELAYYLDNEVVLRQKIIEKISEETETRDKSFRDMLSMSDGFAQAFYDRHTTLFNQVAEIYKIDLNNFKTANDAKMALLGAMNSAMAESGRAMAEQMGGGTTGQLAYYKQLLELRTSSGMMGGASEAWGNYTKAERGFGEGALSLEGLKSQIAFLEAQESMLNDFKAPNLSKFKPAKSGSKKSSTKQHVDDIDLVVDRYKKFEKAINEVGRALKNLEGLMDLSSGKDRIKLMEQQNNLLREQQRLLNLRANEERKEQAELAKTLGARGINLSDGTYGLDSFTQYSKSTENSINSIISKINATSNDKLRENLNKQKDDMQKTYNKVKEDFDRYVDLKDSIPNLGAEWWALEYEALRTMLDAVDVRYDEYNKQIAYLNDSMKYMLGVREDNTKELEREKQVMLEISGLYKSVLSDIEQQAQSSNDKVQALEKTLGQISNKESTQYQTTSRQLIMARAERDKYFEQYKIQLDNLASHQMALIENYNKEVERARDKTLKSIEDIRKEFTGFDDSGFIQSLEKIILDLDIIDSIFMSGAKVNLVTDQARKDIEQWKNDIIDTANQLKNIEQDVKKIGAREVKNKSDIEKKQNALVEKAKEQVELENQLKDLNKELQDQIADRELQNKKIESSLQNQIDLKQKEIEKVREQYEYENKIRAMKEKQLELLRAMDDTRYSYITGLGEEVFTYDQDRVLQLQKELADMQRQEEQENEIARIESEVVKMQEELTKTKEINKQELEILKLAQKGIAELITTTSKGIDETKNEITLAYSQMSESFANDIKESMKEFTNVYQDYWDSKLNGIIAEFSNISREVDKSKLGGKAGEKFGTNGSQVFKPSDFKDSAKEGIKQGYNSIDGATKIYNAKANDTLETIAKQFNTTIDTLKQYNLKYKTNDNVKAGDVLVVPDRFDSGGYTGNFGVNPKLALVDSKELILDKNDTSNLLETISILNETTKERDNKSKYEIEKKQEGNVSHLYMYNPEFNEVKDTEDFVDSFYEWTRKGMPKR